MDITAAQEIDTRLTVATASETINVIMHLADVEFMASIGIGVMVRAANALLKRKGKMVFMNPQPHVLSALDSTLITKVIPVVHDLVAARIYFNDSFNNQPV